MPFQKAEKGISLKGSKGKWFFQEFLKVNSSGLVLEGE